MLSKTFSNPFSLFFGPIYRPKSAQKRGLVVHLKMEKVGRKLQNCFWNVGETDSPGPVTGVTGCDGLHVTGADGLRGWWRSGWVEGWQSACHWVWRPSPWSWNFRTWYFFAEFRRFCAWRPLLLCTWNITKQPA